MAELRFKPGDKVVIVKAAAAPELVNTIHTVQYVGPWKAGEAQPNGGVALADCDYILQEDGYVHSNLFAPGLTCREANLAPLY